MNVIVHDDALNRYQTWPAPTLIISDGAYGLGSFPGEPNSPAELCDWYAPHIECWTRMALPCTTLCFWNTELGWATVHPLITRCGWEYKQTITWDKGLSHIAGNCNTGTLRMFPVVTEICVIYTRKPPMIGGLSLKGWLKSEWKRSGLTLKDANRACSVKDAASRKYLTLDAQWYFPPGPQFACLAHLANMEGKKEGRPYFSLDGHEVCSIEEWERLRPPFRCPVGLTNVWQGQAPRGKRRTHMNQKPEEFMSRLVEAMSEVNDVVWEPFGGTCPVAKVCRQLRRRSFTAEINETFYETSCAEATNV